MLSFNKQKQRLINFLQPETKQKCLIFLISEKNNNNNNNPFE